jgi:hypothetical protein
MSEAAIAQVVEERIAQFAHKAPALIRDSESDVLGVRADDSGVASSGMAYKGKIYLFRDGLSDSSEVVRTVWHGLLHYGLRRFLNSGQYIAAMLHRCWGELQCARKSSTVSVTKKTWAWLVAKAAVTRLVTKESTVAANLRSAAPLSMQEETA